MAVFASRLAGITPFPIAALSREVIDLGIGDMRSLRTACERIRVACDRRC